MQKASHRYTLVIIPVSVPFKLGVYEDGSLKESFVSEKKISESLDTMIMEVLKRYPINDIVYSRGPGSYMAIKLTYIILKTIEIVRGIPFYGCSAFEFNGFQPIKAVGKIYFIHSEEGIVSEKIDNPPAASFELPGSLERLRLDPSNKPDYSMPAVENFAGSAR